MDRGSQLDEEDEDDENDKDDEEDEEEEEEEDEEEGEEKRKEEETTDIKSNNPHLAGGEQAFSMAALNYQKVSRAYVDWLRLDQHHIFRHISPFWAGDIPLLVHLPTTNLKASYPLVNVYIAMENHHL